MGEHILSRETHQRFDLAYGRRHQELVLRGNNPVVVLEPQSVPVEEDVDAIVSRRQELTGAEKTTPAWLVTTGALDPAKFAVLTYNHQLTARSLQYSLDVIGFADHTGTAKRLQVIIEMRGKLAQILFYRDISLLGLAYPVWDDERSEGFGFSNR